MVVRAIVFYFVRGKVITVKLNLTNFISLDLTYLFGYVADNLSHVGLSPKSRSMEIKTIKHINNSELATMCTINNVVFARNLRYW